MQRQFARGDWTRPDSQGCQMIEDRLRLQGWSQERRVVLVRKRIKGSVARQSRRANGQLQLACGRRHTRPIRVAEIRAG